jgi:hypothetical protein
MKHQIMILTFGLLVIAGSLTAQNQATWDPAKPRSGDTITFIYDPSNASAKLGPESETIIFHWGINQTKPGAWLIPPEEMWPPNSIAWSDGKAAHTDMVKQDDGTWQVTIGTLDTIRTIHFVFTNGTVWDNNGAKNWDICLLEDCGGPKHSDIVLFMLYADLGLAIQNRGFTYGDSLIVQAGFFNTAADIKNIVMKRQGISSVYKGYGQVTTTLGDTLDYSYMAKKESKENPEKYFNYQFEDPSSSEAQQRQVPVVLNDQGQLVVRDTVRSSNISPRRPPYFLNQSAIAQDMNVTLTCDVRPAYYHLKLGGARLKDIQGKLAVGDPDSIAILGLAVNGPITGSWSNSIGADWGSHLMTLPNKKMFDDGTNGDETPGDSVYTLQFHFYRDSDDVVGQEFKFGIGGGDNEGGFGNNHFENIDDFTTDSKLETQFGSIDPYFYSEWDYTKKGLNTGIESDRIILPEDPVLSQNFPNPFNPSTTIRYHLSSPQSVVLSVYNLRGERIAVLEDGGKQAAGSHTVVWNGKDANGRPVSAGVYLIRLETRNFVQMRKMVLVK